MKTALRILTVALLATVAGCTPGGEADSSDEAAPSCAGVVTYENRTYLPAGEVGFTVGERLGTAETAECNDTPGEPEVAVPAGTTAAYAVEGRNPAEAIAVGDSPAAARLMEVD
ncbi:DUF6281 family protein [Streptomyces sviceus]|uniref:DUF6281 family protein n=1 Tax=Streptomyces sviceus TaxID=285530 RepID=UPI0036EC1155